MNKRVELETINKFIEGLEDIEEYIEENAKWVKADEAGDTFVTDEETNKKFKLLDTILHYFSVKADKLEKKISREEWEKEYKKKCYKKQALYAELGYRVWIKNAYDRNDKKIKRIEKKLMRLIEEIILLEEMGKL